MAAVKVTVRSPILASNAAVPLVIVVRPSAIRTWVGCPFCGVQFSGLHMIFVLGSRVVLLLSLT